VSVTEIDLEMHALVMVNQSTCTKKGCVHILLPI
jgi:hypothetical protein